MTSLYRDKGKAALGKGFQLPVGSLADRELASLLGAYRKRVAASYRGLDQSEFKSGLLEGPLLVSPKVDGELWYLVLEGDEALLANAGGRIVGGGVPLLEEARKTALARAEGRTVIAGELFAARKDGRPRLNDLKAAMGGGKDAAVERLGFVGFDLLMGGTAAQPHCGEDYAERLSVIEALLEGGKRARAVPTERLDDVAGLAGKYAELVESGKAEGLIVRTASGLIAKLKPEFSLDLAVIGFTDHQQYPDAAGSLLLAWIRDDGNFQVVGGCGNLGDQAARAKLRKQLMPACVESNYRHASSSGAMYQMVRPELVVEVRVSDIQSEDAGGGPVDKMVLQLDDTDGWTALKPSPSVSLIHPVLKRLRDDKQVKPEDVRASQVLERCAPDELDQAIAQQDLPASEVLRREVYTKTAKDKTMVRKILVWKTNKEQHAPAFPAYVTAYVDYSPGRAAPLKREVRLAPSEQMAMGLADEMVAKNILKGWNPVEP